MIGRGPYVLEYRAPGGGERTRPASTSPWQFAHRSTHFFASARNFASALPCMALTVNVGEAVTRRHRLGCRVDVVEVEVERAAVVGRRLLRDLRLAL
jgi:hypothetical protein